MELYLKRFIVCLFVVSVSVFSTASIDAAPPKKEKFQFIIELGMVEFAEAIYLLENFNLFDMENCMQRVIEKFDRAIELDRHKSCYFALRALWEDRTDLNEKALIDYTQAIQIAETHDTEWLLGTKQSAKDLGAIETYPSGHFRYDTAFEVKIDKGELYYSRYKLYKWLDREDEPCAISDLEKAAALGYEEAIEELKEREL